jgi:hypothetical protein
MKLHEIATKHDAVAIYERPLHGDGIAMLARHYDENGLKVVRFAPEACDFYPLAEWEAAEDDRICAMLA